MFARRLPDSDELVKAVVRNLDSKWWEPHKMLERHERDLGKLGASKMFLRLRRWMSNANSHPERSD